MGDDGYRLLFDARDHWPPLWFALPGFLFIALSRWAWTTRANGDWWKWPADTRRWLRTLQAGCMLAFSIFWTSAVVVIGIWEYASARRSLESGDFSVVEGIVTNYAGGKFEHFEVGDLTFQYSVGAVTADARAHGRTFENGLPVRIHYDPHRGNPRILKLELYEGVVCR